MQNFIEITSDYGRIGNIYWSNSSTMPDQDLFTQRIITYWGWFLLHPPEPNIHYGEIVCMDNFNPNQWITVDSYPEDLPAIGSINFWLLCNQEEVSEFNQQRDQHIIDVLYQQFDSEQRD